MYLPTMYATHQNENSPVKVSSCSAFADLLKPSMRISPLRCHHMNMYDKYPAHLIARFVQCFALHSIQKGSSLLSAYNRLLKWQV
jgi:hypothetical protein